MELQRERGCRIDAAVELRINLRIVSGVRAGLGLGAFKADLRRVITESLVRPDWSRWTAFDRTGQAGLSVDQGWIQRLLRLVRLRLWNRSQATGQGVRDTLGHVKARHRCAERLHSKCRAGRCAGGNAVAGIVGEDSGIVPAAAGISAGNERMEAVNGGQCATCCDQAP